MLHRLPAIGGWRAGPRPGSMTLFAPRPSAQRRRRKIIVARSEGSCAAEEATLQEFGTRHHRPHPRLPGHPAQLENWVAHDERRGYRVLAPAYPGFDVEGMPVTPLSRIKSTFPVLRHPASRHKAVSYDLEQSDRAFASTSDEDRARWPYGRYAVPVSGRIRSRCAP